MPETVAFADAVNVAPSAMVRVDPVAGAVIATLLTLVAVATPIVGVVRVGEVPKTSTPDPVSLLITPASCALVVDANWLSGFAVKASPAPAEPFDAAVMRPSASTVMLESV